LYRRHEALIKLGALGINENRVWWRVLLHSQTCGCALELVKSCAISADACGIVVAGVECRLKLRATMQR
jgi:hypothetical protein